MVVVKTEQKAREVALFRQDKAKEVKMAKQQSAKLEDLFKDVGNPLDDFKGDNLTQPLKDYIKTIEDFVGIPVGIIAYGPERSEIMFRQEYFQ